MSKSVEHYTTIAKPSEGLYKEKGSKFLAFAFPVTSEGEVKAALDKLRKSYYDARHHCYAYMLGAERQNYRANDDGEPGHSAGDPILGQINARGLTDVLVVVVRYFGGTKLGVGGLISAYKTAAEEALAQAAVQEVEIKLPVKITYDYEATNDIMRLMSDFKVEIRDQQFEIRCTTLGLLPVGLKGSFLDKVELLQATGTALEVQLD